MNKIFSYISNIARQTRNPETKIFFIGFNKCGTTSLHHLMKGCGIRSVHWENGTENITDGIDERLSDPAELRTYLSRWTAYSDLISSSDTRISEGNRHFALYHQLFPKSYFVMNDRDIEAWLLSRERHARGTFLLQSMQFHGTDRTGVIDLWRKQYFAHKNDVLRYFSGNERFLRYKIDKDPIHNIVDFLSPDFRINPSDWRVYKKTKAGN